MPITLQADDSILNQLNANDDTGVWLEQNLTANLHDDWFVVFHAEQRFGSRCRKGWDYFYQAIFQYNLTPWLCPESVLKEITAGPGFNMTDVLQKNSLGDYQWVWVHRPLLEANLKMELSEWKIGHRARAQYHIYSSRDYDDYFNFRYRLSVNTPWKWTCLNINPYVSNEWFLRPETYRRSTDTGLVGGYYSNRLRLGVEADLYGDRISGALYGQWRAQKKTPTTHPRWFNTYQLGLVLNITL